MQSVKPDVKSIFGRALEIESPTDRAAYLDRACAGDGDVRAEIESLLSHVGQAGAFMGRAASSDATEDFAPIPERPGVVIGPFKLMEQIGEGGMGLVFVAEQQHPVRRKVALKIIKPGMDTRDVIARFEAERQALALMDHPNIARVFDAGATESGLPYFVMELVKGIPIVDYCDGQGLTTRDRLDLFLSVCQAVQHAHGKGIIHRDLKPSNILVAPHDGEPVVKVIDFGVAKAIGQQLTEKTVYTRFAQMIGTPLYMSPEQAEINALDVDIRSDVYSLGVLLYELLTGTTPFDKKRFATAAYDEIRRIIKEEEPPRPSTRLSSLGEMLSTVSTHRKTEPAKLFALIKGDLDWIVMKALEKDRRRRYETASSLAADVRRFLAEEPIEARPPSALYRFGKLARRHRVALSTAAFVAAALLLGTAVSLWQAVRATRAESAAVRSETAAVAERDSATAKQREAEAAREHLRRALYAADLGLVQVSWEGGRVEEVLELLKREKAASPDLCGFEWNYWMRRCHEDLRTINFDRTSELPAFSADGSRLVTRRPPRFVICDTTVGKQVATVTIPECEASGMPTFSTDGGRMAVGIVTKPDRGVRRHEVAVVDVNSGRKTGAVTGLSRFPSAAVFNRDGTRLAGIIPSAYQPGKPIVSALCIWDAETGREVRSIPELIGSAGIPAFSPDGSRIAAISQIPGKPSEAFVRMWEVKSGRLVGSFPAFVSGPASTVLFSPDGKLLAGVGRGAPSGFVLQVWEVESGYLRIFLRERSRFWNAAAAFSPDSRRIACPLSNFRIGVWDASDGKELTSFQGHLGRVSAVAFSQDGRKVLSADDRDSVKIWDALGRADTVNIVQERLPSFITVSPDASRIATLALPKDGPVVGIWDDTGKKIHSLKPSRSLKYDGNITRRLAFNRDGHRLAYATTTSDWMATRDGYRPGDASKTSNAVTLAEDVVRGVVTVWDEAGQEVFYVEELGTGFGSVALSPDGTRVAASVQERPTKLVRDDHWRVMVWDVASGRRLWSTESPASAIAFGSDGTRLALVSNNSSRNSRIELWDVETGAKATQWEGPVGYGASVAFRPDGRQIAATIRFGPGMSTRWELIVCDIASGKVTTVGRGYQTVTYSPDGSRLAGYISDGEAEIGLCDADSGRQLTVLKGHTGIVTYDKVAFDPTGNRIVSAAGTISTTVEVKNWDATPWEEQEGR